MVPATVTESFNHFYGEIRFFEKNINSKKLIKINEENILKIHDFEVCVRNILKSCESIADSLEEYHIFSRELYDFLEIQNMIEMILKNKTLETIKLTELEFLNEILGDFHRIITFRYITTKNNLLNREEIPTENLERYKQEYKNFIVKLRKNRKNFSLKISHPINKNEELDPVNKKMLGVMAEKIVKL